MFKWFKEYFLRWLNWLLCGGKCVDVVSEEEERVVEEESDDSVVAQPFIQSGFSQE